MAVFGLYILCCGWAIHSIYKVVKYNVKKDSIVKYTETDFHQCVFCKKRTENQYTYYKDDKDGLVKYSEFVCTKCVKKKDLYTVLSLTIVFLGIVILITYSRFSGNQTATTGIIIGFFVPFVLLVIWTINIIYKIRKDKQMGNRSGEQKLVKEFREMYPETIYYTSDEI